MTQLNLRSVAIISVIYLCCHVSSAYAGDPVFESKMFKTGTLVYSDDFEGEYNQDRWGPRRNDKQLTDGKLIVTPRFKSKDEAMKALKRDHHLGLEPVVHLNQIPDAFVCHLRYRFDKDELSPGRPVLQIGHHMIVFNYLEGGGHRIKLPEGPTFSEPKSNLKVGEWIDLVIEYRLGELSLGVNGHPGHYRHEAVTIINKKDKLGPRFTFKGGPDCRIIFDSVRLWKCED